MRIFPLLAALLLSLPALAVSRDVGILCSTEQSIDKDAHGGPTTFFFAVKNLESGRPALVENDSDAGPVRMKPANSILFLNDNYGIKRTSDGIQLEADAAGCQLTTVVLYKSAGYQRGWARTKDIGCGVDKYTKLSCRVMSRR